MTNSVDPDQLASEEATDQDLLCLQIWGVSGFSRIRDNNVQFPHLSRLFSSFSNHVNI